jgi:hypothetical protein
VIVVGCVLNGTFCTIVICIKKLQSIQSIHPSRGEAPTVVQISDTVLAGRVCHSSQERWQIITDYFHVVMHFRGEGREPKTLLTT